MAARTQMSKSFGVNLIPIPSRRPPVKNKLAPDGWTDEKKKTKTSKCVSNDRSHHDDQNEYRIIKNGAILKG